MHVTDQRDDVARLANLFGAAALAATGAMTAAAAAVTDGGLSAAAALVTLASDPGIGVTELSRRLGLSQPGATRLVETLAGRGLVHSSPETAGSRGVALRLTGAGLDRARLILAGRGRALADLLAPLGEADRQHLEAALSRVLGRLTDGGAPVHRTCRLCDEQACAADTPCPVEEARRHGGRPC